jgi:hypothetical protein
VPELTRTKVVIHQHVESALRFLHRKGQVVEMLSLLEWGSQTS